MKDKLKSRKFWMSVVGGILLVLEQGLGLDIDTEIITSFVWLILGYITVEGATDVASIIWRRNK